MAGAGLDVECISSVLELPIPEVKAVVDRYKNDTALLEAGIQEYLDSRTGIFQPEEGAGFVESTRRKTKKADDESGGGKAEDGRTDSRRSAPTRGAPRGEGRSENNRDKFDNRRGRGESGERGKGRGKGRESPNPTSERPPREAAPAPAAPSSKASAPCEAPAVVDMSAVPIAEETPPVEMPAAKPAVAKSGPLVNAWSRPLDTSNFAPPAPEPTPETTAEPESAPPVGTRERGRGRGSGRDGRQSSRNKDAETFGDVPGRANRERQPRSRRDGRTEAAPVEAPGLDPVLATDGGLVLPASDGLDALGLDNLGISAADLAAADPAIVSAGAGPVPNEFSPAALPPACSNGALEPPPFGGCFSTAPSAASAATAAPQPLGNLTDLPDGSSVPISLATALPSGNAATLPGFIDKAEAPVPDGDDQSISAGLGQLSLNSAQLNVDALSGMGMLQGGTATRPVPPAPVVPTGNLSALPPGQGMYSAVPPTGIGGVSLPVDGAMASCTTSASCSTACTTSEVGTGSIPSGGAGAATAIPGQPSMPGLPAGSSMAMPGTRPPQQPIDPYAPPPTYGAAAYDPPAPPRGPGLTPGMAPPPAPRPDKEGRSTRSRNKKGKGSGERAGGRGDDRGLGAGGFAGMMPPDGGMASGMGMPPGLVGSGMGLNMGMGRDSNMPVANGSQNNNMMAQQQFPGGPGQQFAYAVPPPGMSGMSPFGMMGGGGMPGGGFGQHAGMPGGLVYAPPGAGMYQGMGASSLYQPPPQQQYNPQQFVPPQQFAGMPPQQYSMPQQPGYQQPPGGGPISMPPGAGMSGPPYSTHGQPNFGGYDDGPDSYAQGGMFGGAPPSGYHYRQP